MKPSETARLDAAKARERIRQLVKLHRGCQHEMDRASGHGDRWYRRMLGRPTRRFTLIQFLAGARGLDLDPAELVAEITTPGPAELLRNAREAVHGQRTPPVWEIVATRPKPKTPEETSEEGAKTQAETPEMLLLARLEKHVEPRSTLPNAETTGAGRVRLGRERVAALIGLVGPLDAAERFDA